MTPVNSAHWGPIFIFTAWLRRKEGLQGAAVCAGTLALHPTAPTTICPTDKRKQEKQGYLEGRGVFHTQLHRSPLVPRLAAPTLLGQNKVAKDLTQRNANLPSSSLL